MSNAKTIGQQEQASFKLDEEGIPILDEVVEEEPQISSVSDKSETETQARAGDGEGEDAEIRRLARAIAAEAAVAFAREIEGRLMKELAPLLERKLKARNEAEEKGEGVNEAT